MVRFSKSSSSVGSNSLNKSVLRRRNRKSTPSFKSRSWNLKKSNPHQAIRSIKSFKAKEALLRSFAGDASSAGSAKASTASQKGRAGCEILGGVSLPSKDEEIFFTEREALPRKAYELIKKHGQKLVGELKRYRLYKPKGLMQPSSSRSELQKWIAEQSSSTFKLAELPEAYQEELLNGAILSDAAYHGISADPKGNHLPSGFRLAQSKDLPDSLRPLYDEASGLLKLPGGAKVLLSESDDALCVAFAGTELQGPRAKQTIMADFFQYMGAFSPIYRDAAGLVGELADASAYADKKISLVGHSLGGGLAQFSLAANIEAHPDRFKAHCYNSSGLSLVYLGTLGKKRVTAATGAIEHIRVQGDPISPAATKKFHPKGILLGTIATLSSKSKLSVNPKVHGSTKVIESLKAEMGSQLGQQASPVS